MVGAIATYIVYDIVTQCSRRSPLSYRPAPLPDGRKLASFSRSIPPSFALSINLQTINTRANWLCSGAFLLPRDLPAAHSLATGHCSRATVLPPHASRLTLHASCLTSGFTSCADPPRWLLPDTDRRIDKDRTGPDLDERSVHIQYVTGPGDSSGQIQPFLQIHRRPTVDHSLVTGGARRQWLQESGRRAEGPPTFWHQTNVGGPFRLPEF